MEFNASPKEVNPLGKCRICGGTVKVLANPIYDNPGDCEPLIDRYLYHAECDTCGVGSKSASTPEKIRCSFVDKEGK